jgi:hypothetical protein
MRLERVTAGEGCGLVVAPIVHHDNLDLGQHRMGAHGHHEVVKEVGETVFFVPTWDNDAKVGLDGFVGAGGCLCGLLPAA